MTDRVAQLEQENADLRAMLRRAVSALTVAAGAASEAERVRDAALDLIGGRVNQPRPALVALPPIDDDEGSRGDVVVIPVIGTVR